MKQQTQTKQLPKGWNLKKIQDFTDVITGGTPSTAVKEYWEGDVPWIRSGELKDCKLFNSEKFITQKGLKESSARMMPQKSVLIALTGATTGKTAILEFEASANQSVTGIIPSKKHIPEYLFYYFQNIRSEVIHKSYGEAQNHISQGFVKKIEIPLPESLQTQQLIVQEIETQFTRLDEAVKSLKVVKEKLAIYRKAVLKKAFEKKEGWEDAEIKNISKDIQYGLTSKSSFDYPGPRYLRITDIQNRKVNWDNVPFAKDIEKIDAYILNEDDLVFARTGATVGKSFLIKSCPKNSVFASYLIRIVPDKSKISPELLYYYFQSPMYWELISQKQIGIGQPNVNGTILSKLPITIPKSLEEQQLIVQEIESKFSVIDKVEEIVNNSLEKAEKLRKSILKSAFEGRLVKEE